jgi:carboxypeptidase Q
MPKRRAIALSLILSLAFFVIPPETCAQETDIHTRIRKEGMEHSQILKTMHMLTDVYGPRLTGSPNHKRAAEWAIKQMQDWGFVNGHLDPWDFKHPGWLNERLTAHVVSPIKDALVCEVLAWTPSTRGTARSKAYQLVLPERPTQKQLDAAFAKEKASVRGRIVLVGKPTIVRVNLEPPPKRTDDKTVAQRFGPEARPTPRPSPSPTPSPAGPLPLTERQVGDQLNKFLKDNGALVRVNDAGRDHGQIRAFSNRSFDVTKVVPTVVMRNEDYGRISRILADGTEVHLEFNIVNRVYPEGKTSYNAIAEIPGADKADEVIMLGGHLDSWHAATGATDNAIGCAIMMEAARILKALEVNPRRTIRVALWSGEEQGLLGSQEYVKEVFGSFETPKPAYQKFGGYFNIDSGTGRIRGASVFGPPEAAAIVREILKPFKADGVAGAIATRSRNLGGTDSTSFNNAGLPGISLAQDAIEYGTHTWHTNLDTYERIVEDDVKKAAVVVASAVYELAMRDELLPRFTKDTMPAPALREAAEQPPAPPKPAPKRNIKTQSREKKG